MSQVAKKISFINIDCDSNYFDTNEQIKLKNTYTFSDKSIVSKVTGSNTSTGYFSNNRIIKIRQTLASNNPYPTSSIVIDGSGNSRKILASDIDIFASSSLDSYKNGVEISREKDWIAGLAKISAGTSGHLYESLRYGIVDVRPQDSLFIVNDSSQDNGESPRNYLRGEWFPTNTQDTSGNARKILTDERPADRLVDMHNFNPVSYIAAGENARSFSFPVETRISKMSENISPDGVIEPLNIRPRPTVAKKYVEDPHKFRGQLSNGNANRRGATDDVLSVDYYSPKSINKVVFLDSPGKLDISTNVTGSFSAYSEEFSNDENVISSFDDVSYLEGTSYIPRGKKSATCGFSFQDAEAGVDSITFGDRSYGNNRDNRRRKRTILPLRDAQPFIRQESLFDDTNTIHFGSQLLEYPSRIPTSFSGSIMNSTVRSEIYSSGSIQVNVSFFKPGNYDSVLYDSIISANKRLGIL